MWPTHKQNIVRPTGQYTDEVLKERVALLFEASGLTLLVSFAVAAIFVAVHANYRPLDQGDLWWGALLGLSLLIRTHNLKQFRRHPERYSSEIWLRRFSLGAQSSAIVWGLGGVLFYSGHHSSLQVFTILVVAGIAAGALSSLAGDFKTYRNYVLLSLLPLVASAIWQGGGLRVGVGLLLLFLTVFLVQSGKRTSQSIVSSLQLRFENKSLVRELEREKNRLLNDAESLMNSVLASAPIALWVIDEHGDIQYIDGSRLQQQTHLQLPTPGSSIFAAFQDVPEVAQYAQRALAGEAFTGEVEIDNAYYEVHYSPLEPDGNGLKRAIGVAIDISERTRHEQELTRRANYDPLTGLANRSFAHEAIERALSRARRSHQQVGLFFFDLDNFKAINDSLGHKTGDQLLKGIAKRLKDHLRDSDFAARISGDEFLVVAEKLRTLEDAEALAHKLTATFDLPFVIEQRPIYASASLGITLFPQDGNTADQLMQRADTAMYAAKTNGRRTFSFFTHEMQQAADRHLSIETQLRLALENEEFELTYQPKVAIHSHQIVGAEALLRWYSPVLGQVPPDQFIPVAELAGLMPTIGDWVFRTACHEAASWLGLSKNPLSIAINMSPQQFRKPDVLEKVERALAASGLPAAQVEVEITEGLLVHDTPDILATFEALTQRGIRIAIDDFGTGYSALSYLHKFPLSVLKIDRAFVTALDNQSDGRPLLNAIIAMAKSLRMTLVAEGVENTAQLDYLAAHDVEMIQGYYFSKPLKAEDFRALVIQTDGGPLPPDQSSKQLGNPLSKSG